MYRADASIQGEATGAMSWAFITSLKKNPNQSYVQLLNSIRDELQQKYSQKPQLSCSHPLGRFAPCQMCLRFLLTDEIDVDKADDQHYK